MRRVGLLSDTHGYLHPKVFEFFRDCDELWHAGDIGDMATFDSLSRFKPIKAVFGNIDGQDIRLSCPMEQLFFCEDMKVYIIHIGGYPGRYNPHALKTIRRENPGLFIAGHSHILKVIWDREHDLLHMNPGSCGLSGLHQVITMMRFTVDCKDIKDLEIFETPRNSAVISGNSPEY